MAEQAILIAAVLSVEALAAPSNAITTRLDMPYASGNLRATFVATPTADGMWSVSAEFKPRGVNSETTHFGCGTLDPTRITLHGTGTSQFIAPPDVVVQIVVQGLYWTFRCDSDLTEPNDLYFGLTVAADGRVSFPHASAAGIAADPAGVPLAGQTSNTAISEQSETSDSWSDTEMAASAPGSVTTSLDLPQCDGRLRTKFVAVPNADGSWNVSAEVRPSRIQMAVHFGIDPGSGARATLKGVGTADFAASPGTPVSVSAPGLRVETRFAGSFDAWVGMLLTVGADGAVSVGSYSVGFNCVFCSISCNN